MQVGTESYFQQICENLAFTLVAVDREMRIQFWNHQAARQFGRSAAEMSGRSVLEVFQESHREQVRSLFEAALQSETPGDLEVKFIHDDGRRFTYALIVSPILDAQGQCLGASASMRDISERKQLSQELSRSRRMASLGHMAGAVAHHFNNILGGMLTSIDSVLTSESPRELRRALRLLAEEIGRATRITKRLSAFAASETEATEWGELNSLLRNFIERVRPQAEKKQVNLITDIQQLPSRLFEAQRLIPVLDSLVQNAFDAMPNGGTLTILAHLKDEQAVIGVSDTGCGIPEELRDRLFEPFFTTKGELGGGDLGNIGLGLAAVHGLVSEMGGKLEITSKVGQGTRVEVRLPLNRPAPKYSD